MVWGRLVRALQQFYGRVPPEDPRIWHKWYSLNAFLRLSNGKSVRNEGQLWRRLGPDGRWEYKQDEETDEERMDRQW